MNFRGMRHLFIFFKDDLAGSVGRGNEVDIFGIALNDYIPEVPADIHGTRREFLCPERREIPVIKRHGNNKENRPDEEQNERDNDPGIRWFFHFVSPFPTNRALSPSAIFLVKIKVPRTAYRQPTNRKTDRPASMSAPPSIARPGNTSP